MWRSYYFWIILLSVGSLLLTGAFIVLASLPTPMGVLVAVVAGGALVWYVLRSLKKTGGQSCPACGQEWHLQP